MYLILGGEVSYEAVITRDELIEKEIKEIKNKGGFIYEKLEEVQVFVDMIAQGNISPSSFFDLKVLVDDLAARNSTETNSSLEMVRRELYEQPALSNKLSELQTIVEYLTNSSISSASFAELKTIVDLLATTFNTDKSVDNPLVNLVDDLNQIKSKVETLGKLCSGHKSNRSLSTGQKNEVEEIQRQNKRREKDLSNVINAANRLIQSKSIA